MKRGTIALATLLVLAGCEGMRRTASSVFHGYSEHQNEVRGTNERGYLSSRLLRSSAMGARYSTRETVGDVEISVAHPFLDDDHLLTSALHLCGTSLAGKRVELVTVRAVNRGREPRKGLRLEASLQGHSDPAVRTFSLDPGQAVEIGLTPAFRDIGSVTEMTPSAILVKLTDADGRLLHESTRRTSLLSRNDIVLSEDFWPFCATVVTPNDPVVVRLSTDAAERAPDRTIAGYRRGPEYVGAEVKAVYETLAARGLHYRSNMVSFVDGGKIPAQRVTFPAEAIEGKGANCLDGAVLFASAFEGIGLQAYLVIVPRHALVGVKLAPDSPGVLFIETTLVGTKPFEEAIRTGAETFRKHHEKGQAVLVDLQQCRELGITPFPYPLH